jgi:hypothetical protein
MRQAGGECCAEDGVSGGMAYVHTACYGGWRPETSLVPNPTQTAENHRRHCS